MNKVMLEGRLAAPAEVRVYESGTQGTRFLLTVKSEDPKRVDVLPIVAFDAPDGFADTAPGTTLKVVGSIRRRFSESVGGRRSRLEIYAEEVTHVEPTS
jgi:single-stranded DNA-binding protein